MSVACISIQQYNIYFTGLGSVTCGEFCGQPTLNFNSQGNLEEGATIIYVPTRKQTLGIAKFLSRFGVKAAAYNAKVTVSSRICQTLNMLFFFIIFSILVLL